MKNGKDYFEIAEEVRDFFPTSFPPGIGARQVWPCVLIACLLGLTLAMAIGIVLEIRRCLYNRNRNRKYARRRLDPAFSAKEGERKNQRWRTRFPDRHRTIIPPPPGFAEDLCRQWDRVHDSFAELLKFGEMLIELEDYVDNSYRLDAPGNIVGRNRGIKGFLRDHCPHITYATAMHYRSLALKARETQRAKLHEIRRESATLRDFHDSLDAHLGVTYRRLDAKRLWVPRERDRNPQLDVFAVREQARSTARRLRRPQRRRFLASLREIVREIEVS